MWARRFLISIRYAWHECIMPVLDLHSTAKSNFAVLAFGQATEVFPRNYPNLVMFVHFEVSSFLHKLCCSLICIFLAYCSRVGYDDGYHLRPVVVVLYVPLPALWIRGSIKMAFPCRCVDMFRLGGPICQVVNKSTNRLGHSS
jgi:hypothetical protein